VGVGVGVGAGAGLVSALAAAHSKGIIAKPQNRVTHLVDSVIGRQGIAARAGLRAWCGGR
jgi:hypothetical protein